MPPAASRAPPSTLDVDEVVDLVALAGVDDRAERDLLGGRIADRQAVGLLGQPRDVLVGDRLVHQVPAGGHADLALVEERAPGAALMHLVEIGVAEHDQRGVAAEFEVRALEVPAGQLADLAPGGGRSGERDDPDVRVLDQRRTGFGAAGQHVQHARGQPGFLEHRRERDPAADRGARVGLEHHGVAERQRGRDRADATGSAAR